MSALSPAARRRATQDAAGEKPPRERLKGFDGLRAIVALLVVTTHMITVGLPPGYFHGTLAFVVNFISAGVGSGIFFAMSGFFNTGSLLGKKEKSLTLGGFYRHFWTRRGLRIFPLYMILLVIALAVPSEPPSEIPWYAYAAMLQNWFFGWGYNGASMTVFTWSLAVDTQFFLLWPVVVWFVPQQKLKWVCLLIFVVSIPVRLVEFTLWGSGAAYMHTTARMGGPALGAFAYLLTREFPSIAEKGSRVLMGPLFFAATLLMGGGIMAHGGEFAMVVGYPYLGLTWACLILYIRLQPPWLVRVLDWGPLRETGRASYGVYLFHGVALNLVLGPMLNMGVKVTDSWLTMTAYPVLVFVVTALLVRLVRPIEKWFESWEDRLAP
jgi:peptidoglycan/LPS O-acetylase OafA/YrhL